MYYRRCFIGKGFDPISRYLERALEHLYDTVWLIGKVARDLLYDHFSCYASKFPNICTFYLQLV